MRSSSERPSISALSRRAATGRQSLRLSAISMMARTPLEFGIAPNSAGLSDRCMSRGAGGADALIQIIRFLHDSKDLAQHRAAARNRHAALVRLEASQNCATGVHLNGLAARLDERRTAALEPSRRVTLSMDPANPVARSWPDCPCPCVPSPGVRPLPRPFSASGCGHRTGRRSPRTPRRAEAARR